MVADKTVDSRVLEMQFDNKNFEKNVFTSLSTLDKLKKALNFDDSTKSFDKVEKASKGLNFDKLINTCTLLEKRFSVFGEISTAAIHRVTNSMIDLGTKTINFLTNGITQGGLKRAMNLEQANFQLQGLLKNTEAVAAIMEDVSWSVDGTAYGLDAAAKAASMFAATGMRAGDEMKSALRGVAGVAAMTNSEYESIANIFTTVAGQGRVMGDQLNQLASRGLNAAATLADYLTKVGDGAKVTESDVREMVSKGKIDFATFAAAMDDAFGEHAKAANKTFNGAMSNIRAALSRIGADFISPLIVQEGSLVKLLNMIRIKINDIRKLTTPFAKETTDWLIDLIDKTAEFASGLDFSYNSTIVRVVKLNFDTLMNVATAFHRLLLAIGSGFKDAFPESLSNVLITVSEKINGLSARLIPTTNAFGRIRDISKGFFATLDIGVNLLRALYDILKPVISLFGNLGSKILDGAAYLGRWLYEMDRVVKKNDIFNKAFDKTASVIKDAKDRISNYIEIIGEKINLPTLDDFIEQIKYFKREVSQNFKFQGFSSFGDVLDKLKEKFSGVKNIAVEVRNTFLDLFKKIWDKLPTLDLGNVLESLVRGTTNALTELIKFVHDLNYDDIAKIFAPFIAGGLGLSVHKGMDNIGKEFSNFFTFLKSPFTGANTITTSINNVLGSLNKSITAFQKGIEADTLLKIAGAIAILTLSIAKIASIDSDKIGSSLGAITVLMADLMASMAGFSRISGDTSGTGAMIGIAAALYIVTKALKQVAAIDTDKIGQALGGITILLGELVTSIKLLNSDQKTMLKGASNIVILSAAIAILAKVAKSLSSLNWEELGKGLAGVGGLLAELDIFANTVKINNKAFSNAAGLVITAAAIKILESACKSFAGMDWASIGKGLTGVGGLLTELAIFTRITSGSKNLISIGLGMIALSAALEVLADVMKKISALSWEGIAKGFVTIGGALAGVAIAVKSMPKGLFKEMASLGGGLLITSIALEVLADVMKKISALSWEGIAKGFVTIGGALAEFAIGLNYMKGTIGASAALLVASAALLLLAPSLTMLSKLSWSGLAKGLIALAGAFTIIGIAGYALSPVANTILKISGGLALLLTAVTALMASSAFAALSGGISNLFSGINNLNNALTIESIQAIAANIVRMGTIIVTTFIEILAESLGTVCDFVIEYAPKLVEALLTLIFETLNQLNQDLPMIAQSMIDMFNTLMPILNENAPQIIDQLITFIISIFDAITARVPELGDSIWAFLEVLISSIMDKLREINPMSMLEAVEFIGLLYLALKGLGLLSGVAKEAMLGILAVAAVVAEIGILIAAFGGLAQIPGAAWLVEEGGEFLKKIGDAIGGFFGSIASSFIEEISTALPVLGENLSKFMTNLDPFIQGAKGIDISVLEGVTYLTGAIIELTAAQMISGIQKFLPFLGSMDDFGATLTAFGNAMVDFSSIVSGKVDPLAIVASATAAQAMAELQNALPSKGGKLQQWFGEKMDLDVWGANLAIFGEKLVDYSNTITSGGGINPQAIQDSATAAGALAELNKNLPYTGGKLQQWLGENMDLETFGNNLAIFGKKLVEYSTEITKGSGLDIPAMNDAADAASKLKDLQTGLPTVGGKLQDWFGGTMDLETFGTQIVAFARALTSFCAVVTGAKSTDGPVKPEAIKESAEAAQYLVDLQDALPDESGWWQEVFGGGTMDIAAWGQKLVEFGKALSNYSAQITLLNGINLGAIQNSYDATKILVDLYGLIPKDEGWFSTDKMDAFGVSLKVFGERFAPAVDNLTKTSSTSVRAAVDNIIALVGAVKSMKDLTSSDAKGFVDSIKTLGETGIDAFVASFEGSGNKVEIGIRAFITSAVNAIKKNQNGVVTAVENVIDRVLTKAATYKNKFILLGNTLVTEFSNGIKKAKEEPKSEFSGVLDLALSIVKTSYNTKFRSAGAELIKSSAAGITSEKQTFSNRLNEVLASGEKTISDKSTVYKNSASAMMKQFVAGVNEAKPLSTSAISTLLSDMLKITNSKQTEFKTAGSKLMSSTGSGMSSQSGNVQRVGQNVVDGIYNVIHRYGDKNNKFWKTGEYYADAIANGVDYKAYKALSTAKRLAENMDLAIRRTLKINSPSKVGFETASYYGESIQLGLASWLSRVYDTSAELGKNLDDGLTSAIDSAMMTISERFQLHPVITPEVDADNALATVAQLNALFDNPRTFATASVIRSKMSVPNQNGISEAIPTVPTNVNYNFEQNNYSPKAISRIELYRQTNNQFTAFKEATATR